MTKTQDRDDELVALWRFEARSRVSERALTEYARYVRELRAHTQAPLTETTSLQLRTFMLANAGRWAPGTLSVARRAVRSLFAWLHEQGLTEANPSLAIPAVRCPETVVRVADDRVRQAVVAACRSARDVALIEMLFGTGMRRGECLALNVDDVSVADRSVRINRSKSGKVRRAPLDPRATAALGAWLLERERIGPDSDALWVQPDGAALSVAGGRTAIRRVAARSGVKFSSHDARRSFATRWLAAGGSETLLQSAAGWANGAMVARYTRMDKERLAHDEARRLFG